MAQELNSKSEARVGRKRHNFEVQNSALAAGPGPGRTNVPSRSRDGPCLEPGKPGQTCNMPRQGDAADALVSLI